MLKHRIIPSLQLDNGGLVKSIEFSANKYIGDPLNAIKIFNDKEADEIVILDITKNHQEINFELIENMAGEAFMPVSYGGKIRSLNDAEKLFKIGIEKIILNNSALKNPELIEEISNASGSSSVVIAINTKKSLFGKYEVYSSDGKINLKIPLNEHIEKMILKGAGEIIICDISRDGSMLGLNKDLIKFLNFNFSIPVLISGGCSNLDDAIKAINSDNISGVVAGSIFVFHGKLKAVLISYPKEEELRGKIYET